MKKVIYGSGILLLATAVLASGARLEAQDRSRVPGQRQQGAFLPLVGPGSLVGVTVRDSEAGVVIQEVRGESPAARAGLMQGDIVTEFDGERARSAAQFTRLVRETAPGQIVKMTVLRSGMPMTMDITPETRNSSDLAFPDLAREFRRQLETWPRDFNFEFDAEGGVFALLSPRRLGVIVTPLSDQLATYFGVKQGVLVSEVTAGSAGEMAGLKAGDVITMVRGQAVSDPDDVVRELRAAESGASIEIRVTRDRKEVTLTATLPERPRTTARPRGRAI